MLPDEITVGTAPDTFTLVKIGMSGRRSEFVNVADLDVRALVSHETTKAKMERSLLKVTRNINVTDATGKITPRQLSASVQFSSWPGMTVDDISEIITDVITLINTTVVKEKLIRREI